MKKRLIFITTIVLAFILAIGANAAASDKQDLYDMAYNACPASYRQYYMGAVQNILDMIPNDDVDANDVSVIQGYVDEGLAMYSAVGDHGPSLSDYSDKIYNNERVIAKSLDLFYAICEQLGLGVERRNGMNDTYDTCIYVVSYGGKEIPLDGDDLIKPGTGSSGGSIVTKSYSVKFETNGGSEITKIRVKRNGTVRLPEDPVKEGYVFEGWFTDEELTVPFDPETRVKEGFTLYAKWSEAVTEPDDGDEKKDDEGKQPGGVSAGDCPKDNTCPIYPFTDAETNDWYHDGVHYCIENGIMKGYPGELFGPDNNTTRAQVVMMLWRLEGEPTVNYAMSFEDVGDAWYTEAIRWAASTGVVDGYDDVTFGPNDSITREQLVTMMWRYAKYKGVDVSVGENTNILSYDDASEVGEWAVPAMQWACGTGVVRGVTETTLDPKTNATRAQIATIFYRYCENII